MTHYAVISVLPEIFCSFNTTGIIHRAIQSGLISIETINPRDHAQGRHRTVDDAPYGGGNGMLLKPDPLIAAMEAAPPSSHRVLLTPAGIPFDQTQAARLANFDTLTLICGRYEGFDARVEAYVDEEISIGDFVLLGGEVAAMALIEATARLQPGVLGNHN
ncbi:MAG: tRNA (guanosine(37)-N1)-methyltransferase TrmD, partial [Myxococcota bacterium]